MLFLRFAKWKTHAWVSQFRTNKARPPQFVEASLFFMIDSRKIVGVAVDFGQSKYQRKSL